MVELDRRRRGTRSSKRKSADNDEAGRRLMEFATNEDFEDSNTNTDTNNKGTSADVRKGGGNKDRASRSNKSNSPNIGSK